MKDADFHDYIIKDRMRGIEGVESKPMFGGYGLYRYGIIFAFIIDSTLYFKVDDTNRHLYEKAGSKPFTYRFKSGKTGSMSYYEVPADVLEDDIKLTDWIKLSCAIKRKK